MQKKTNYPDLVASYDTQPENNVASGADWLVVVVWP